MNIADKMRMVYCMAWDKGAVGAVGAVEDPIVENMVKSADKREHSPT